MRIPFKKAIAFSQAGAAMAVWTALILFLAGITLYLQHVNTIKAAEKEAQDYFNLNLSYRAWASRMGGVYVPVEKAPPNPYLISPRRDRVTTKGEELTLVNPAYMTSMVFDTIRQNSPTPIVNKITSLKPLNPANAPDGWEQEALLAFEKSAATSRTEVTTLNGAPYLRFISRFVTDETCLACHKHQGYSVGDIRGAITISIPLTGYYDAEAAERGNLIAGYLLLWTVGSAGIAVSSRRRAAYQRQLQESEEKFRTICDWNQDWEYWSDPNGAMKYTSPSCLEHTGYRAEELVRDPGLVSRMVHPEDLHLFKKHLEILPVCRHHAPESLEFRIVTRQGEVRWMHHICRPVFSQGEYSGRRVSNRDVTDRKLAEQELALRAALLNRVTDSVLVIDRNGRILDANEVAWQSRGYSREEFLTLTIADLSVPEYARLVPDRLETIFRQGYSSLESRHLLKDGRVIEVEVNTRVIQYRGEPTILSSVRDITQRKQTEASLRRSERLNASLNLVSRALLNCRSDGEMFHELLTVLLSIFESPSGCAAGIAESGVPVCPSRQAGACSEQMLLGSGCSIEIVRRTRGIWGECLEKGRGSCCNSLPAGESPFERCLSVPLLYQERCIGLLMVANAPRDYNDEDLQMLTAIAAQVAPVLQARHEQQQAAVALTESEGRLSVLFDVMQSGVLQIDQQGLVTFANQHMAAMLNLPMERLLGSNYLSHVLPEHREIAREKMLQVLQGEVDVYNAERRYRRSDGSDFWGHICGRRLTTPDNRSICMVATVSDMTELKLAEEERHKTEQQMLHVQKLESLGVLAGGIAHDFNNILLVIMGNASLAQYQVAPGSPVEAYLQHIQSAAEKAADLARQMLAYSGKGRFVLETIDLNLLVREMTAMLEASISKKAQLRLELAESLPFILADPTQIRQIVMNLAINASEAIGEGGGAISIATGSRYCDSGYLAGTWLHDKLTAGVYAYLEVTDNGCGMDPETVARIFEPFFTTKFTGRGLGMSAIQGIVRGHKGAIRVTSEAGKGSCFRVYIPANEQEALPPPLPTSETAWMGAGTVLLVDDEQAVRAVGCEMLTALGFSVLEAADGMEALELYRPRQNEIDLVLMDLNMPLLSGEETFHELRKINRGVRVVLSSGFSEQEVTRKFLGKGLAGFVQKPYTIGILRQTLSRLF